MHQKAIFTIVGNGGEIFKIWYRYYQQFFEPQDIYLLAFNSTDGSTDGLNCNIEKYPEKIICKEQVPEHNKFLNKYKSNLLQRYKYIVYTDYDEILYHKDGLDKFIDELKENYCNPFGYEIVQKRAQNYEPVDHTEPPFDYTKSVLSQRSFWYRNSAFDKPLITSMDFNWSRGNHSAYVSLPDLVAGRSKPKHTLPIKKANIRLPKLYKEEFYLLHLKHIDYARCEKSYPDMDLRKHWLNLNRKLLQIPTEIRDADFI